MAALHELEMVLRQPALTMCCVVQQLPLQLWAVSAQLAVLLGGVLIQCLWDAPIKCFCRLAAAAVIVLSDQ